MAFGGLGGGSDDGFGEFLVLLHAFGEGHAAEHTVSGGVFAPCGTCQVATDDHLHGESLATVADGHHRVRVGQSPVGHDVGGRLEEVCGDLVDYLSLEGDALGKNHVEGRDTVGGNHGEQVVLDGVNVAYFSVVDGCLTGKVEVGFQQSFHMSRNECFPVG